MQLIRPAETSQPVMLYLFSERVSCGFPSPVHDYVEDRVDLNKLLIKNPSATYFMKVSGEAMHGAGISDGDLLVVDRSISAMHGDVVIAAVSGEFTVKELRTHPFLQLVPYNRKFPSVSFKKAEELEIFGVVTFSVKALK